MKKVLIILAALIALIAFLSIAYTPYQTYTSIQNGTSVDTQEKSTMHRDFSVEGGNFAPLKGILMIANSVHSIGKKKEKVFGSDISLNNYEIVAPVKVELPSSFLKSKTGERLGHYILSVGADPQGRVKRSFLKDIHTYWLRKTPEELKNYKLLEARKFLWLVNEEYVLYSQPYSESPGATYQLYANGNFIRISLISFESGEGLGGLSNFVENNVIFDVNGSMIRPTNDPQFDPSIFLKMYSNGFFRK